MKIMRDGRVRSAAHRTGRKNAQPLFHLGDIVRFGCVVYKERDLEVDPSQGIELLTPFVED